MTTPETQQDKVVELVPAPKANLGGRGRQRAAASDMASALLTGGATTTATPGGAAPAPAAPRRPAADAHEPSPTSGPTTAADEQVLPHVPPQPSPAAATAPADEDQDKQPRPRVAHRSALADSDDDAEEPAPRIPPQTVVRDRGETDESDDGWISPAIVSGRRRVEDSFVPDDEFAEVTFQTSIYLAGTDIPKAKKLAKLDGITHAAVVMDAVDAANEAGVLSELVAARRTDSRPESSLFPSRRAMRPRAAQTGPRGSLFPVQMTEAQCDVLDNLAAELGAASRSALVSVAMAWYLRTPRVVRVLTRKAR